MIYKAPTSIKNRGAMGHIEGCKIQCDAGRQLPDVFDRML